MQIYILIFSIEFVKIHENKPQIYHISYQIVDIKFGYSFIYKFKYFSFLLLFGANSA